MLEDTPPPYGSVFISEVDSPPQLPTKWNICDTLIAGLAFITVAAICVTLVYGIFIAEIVVGSINEPIICKYQEQAFSNIAIEPHVGDILNNVWLIIDGVVHIIGISIFLIVFVYLKIKNKLSRTIWVWMTLTGVVWSAIGIKFYVLTKTQCEEHELKNSNVITSMPDIFTLNFIRLLSVTMIDCLLLIFSVIYYIN